LIHFYKREEEGQDVEAGRGPDDDGHADADSI